MKKFVVVDNKRYYAYKRETIPSLVKYAEKIFHLLTKNGNKSIDVDDFITVLYYVKDISCTMRDVYLRLVRLFGFEESFK